MVEREVMPKGLQHEPERASSFSYTRKDAYAVHKNFQHGRDVACAVSWYDAAVFAIHAGGRLATSTEIRGLGYHGDFLFWCIDWHTEATSYVCVFNPSTSEIQGLNPDVRLGRTALAIVGR